MKARLMQKVTNLAKDGTAPIYVECVLSHGVKRYIPTGKRIPIWAWNIEKHEVRKTYPDHQTVNAIIKARLREVGAIIDKAILEKEEITPQQLEETLNEGGQAKKKDVSLNIYLEDWIKASVGARTSQVVSYYRVLQHHLMGYAEKRKRVLSIKDLNHQLFEDFRKYLETEVQVSTGVVGMKPNTVGNQIKNLKIFLRYLMRNDIIKHIDLDELKKPSEAGDHVYLNDDEIERLLNTEMPNPALALTRDMFIVGCETGLRFSDYSTLSVDHIDGNFIKKPTKKTGKKVQIPISNRLSKVLERHEGDFPKDINSVVFNRQIKQVCKIAGLNSIEHKQERRGTSKRELQLPKWAMVSSHTCRRSFCTNQFLRGIPTFLIRKISGHATEEAFLKYIRIDEERAAEEMAKLWAERG